MEIGCLCKSGVNKPINKNKKTSLLAKTENG
jgi:hypothetical protein